MISSGGSIDGTLALGGGVRYNFADGTLDGNGQINVLEDGTSIATTGSPNAVINPDIMLNSDSVAGSFRTNIGAVSGSTMVINGTISGDSDVRFSAGNSGGAGILTLNSANTYTGVTEINTAQSGVIRLGVENALPTTTGVTWGVTQNSGSIDLNGFDQTLTYIATTANVTGGIANTGAAATLTLNQDTDTTFGARIGEVSNVTNLTGWNNDISLVKNGTGELTLTGANTYTGSTIVNAGTLVLGTGGSLASALIDVKAGATFDTSAVMGGFQLGANQTLTGAGLFVGNLQIGDDATFSGSGVIEGNLSFSADAAFDISNALLNPIQIDSDFFTVSFASGFGIANLTGVDWETVNLGSYLLIDTDQVFGPGSIANLGLANAVNVGGGRQAYFTSGSLELNVIPEPGTWLLVLIGLSVFVIRRKLRSLHVN